MRKQGLFTLAFMLMLPFTAFAADATSAPPSVTMSSQGMVPEPPVCNASNQMLHWTGSAWQCISNPGVTQVGRGAIERITTGSCPAGTTRHHNSAFLQHTYMCIKN